MRKLLTTKQRADIQEYGFAWSETYGRFIESSEGPFIDEATKKVAKPEPTPSADAEWQFLREANGVLNRLGDELVKFTEDVKKEVSGIQTNPSVDRVAPPPVIEFQPSFTINMPEGLINPQLIAPGGQEEITVERDAEGFISRLIKRFVKLGDQAEGPPTLRDQVRTSMRLKRETN